MSQPTKTNDFLLLIDQYLGISQNPIEKQVLEYFKNYLIELYEDEDEILDEDVSMYEVDDFIHFHLENKYSEEFLKLSNSLNSTFKNFIKFLNKYSNIPKEELEEWKEVLK
jgi:hypothetical protein